MKTKRIWSVAIGGPGSCCYIKTKSGARKLFTRENAELAAKEIQDETHIVTRNQRAACQHTKTLLSD